MGLKVWSGAFIDVGPLPRHRIPAQVGIRLEASCRLHENDGLASRQNNELTNFRMHLTTGWLLMVYPCAAFWSIQQDIHVPKPPFA